jgi:peptidylglycine monooxygenase
MSLQGPSGVAVDSMDRVYVYQRQGPPVLVFDRNGHFLEPWERRNGVPMDAHHIHVGPDDTVYLTDRDAHQVLLYDTGGNLQRSLGTRDRAAMQAPFNHPADVCVAPSGEIYVADGYGNSSVHRFSATGDYISSFGSPGSGPGQFRVPHSVRVSQDGRVYVADRENHRVQVFTAEGEFQAEWTDFKCPMGVHIDANQVVYVTDQIPRISIFTLDGELLARGRTFEGAHQVYTDSQGSIYGIDTANQRVQKFAKL